MKIAIILMLTGLAIMAKASAQKSKQLINVMKTKLGVPYVWGGESMVEGGFDCSGLVQWAYAQLGISVPRRVTEQAQQAPRRVELTGKSLSDGLRLLREGDQIALDYTPGGRYSHVGTYKGKDSNGVPWLIVASGGEHTPGEVEEQVLSQWWADNWRTAYSYL